MDAVANCVAGSNVIFCASCQLLKLPPASTMPVNGTSPSMPNTGKKAHLRLLFHRLYL